MFNINYLFFCMYYLNNNKSITFFLYPIHVFCIFILNGNLKYSEIFTGKCGFIDCRAKQDTCAGRWENYHKKTGKKHCFFK